MQVLGEVLQRVPLLEERQLVARMEVGDAREIRRDDLHRRVLLLMVTEELAAEHGKERIEPAGVWKASLAA